MRHIILLSHEILAYGLLQTARHVLGSVEGCTAYCAYMNPYINDEEAIERAHWFYTRRGFNSGDGHVGE